MESRNVFVSIAVAAGLFATGAVAQHEEHQKGEPAPTAGKTDTGKTGNMMSGNMMSQMSQSMMGQDEISKLVKELMKSFAAIEGEQDQTSVHKKLAEHGLLLEQLQTKVQAQSNMMEMMQQHMMGGAMMGGEGKNGEHK